MNPTIAYITQVLASHYPQEEANEMAYWIVEETTGKQRTELLLNQHPIEILNLQSVLRRLLNDEPIQYIFSHCLWNGLDLRVNRSTLIPRPETAELVDYILINEKQPDVSVLDVGTGSGCIAISLKQHRPSWHIEACDISKDALTIAQYNAERNKADIHFFQHDILSPLNKRYDLVVSNPPYVTDSEKATMKPNVLNYEPSSALFVPDNDPLLFYRAIVQAHIAPRLYFEINERMANEMAELLKNEGYANLTIRQDSYGKQRMLRAVAAC